MRFLANKKLIALALLMFIAPISVAAQNIATVRGAIVNKAFNVDYGRDRQDILLITRLDDSGSFVGFYYPAMSPRPASTNVTGSISIVQGERAGIGNNAIRISFAVSTRKGGSPTTSALVSTTTYEGAIRLDRAGMHFMAGTYTSSDALGAQGPFPFCARVTPG